MDWMDVQALDAQKARRDGSSGSVGAAGGGPGDPNVAASLATLNEPQRDAVTHGVGPLLILAGPGSGKTRVITTRIAHLVTEQHVDPHDILAITFTNKAAREMRERCERILPDTSGWWISTFHSMCARILRRDVEVLGGYTRDFSIYDTSDRNALLKRLIKDKGLDLKRFRPAMVGGWISTMKNAPSEDETPWAGDEEYEGEEFHELRRAYEAAMLAANALDFDDLLLVVLELFERHPGVRDTYSHRFRHVLVDEYQDTNRVQYRLVQHLASVHGNLVACGDPDQSIYAWRGADVRNILDFEDDFGRPQADGAAIKVVKLEQNYRSSGNILKAADAVIANNSARKEKGLWTEREDGEQICVLECSDENDEAREIADQIRSLHARGQAYSKCAIFYRANFMQRALESALRFSKIPYQVVGGVEFYARREIKDLLSFVRLLVNPADNIAFRRVVNVPGRGVGEKSIASLTEFADSRGLPLLAAARDPEALQHIRGRAKAGIANFVQLIERLEPLAEAPAALALESTLEEMDSERWLAEMDDAGPGTDREANVDELLNHAAEFDRLHPDAKLRGFLLDVALVSDIDSLEDDADKAVLMTLHAAKGLEFPAVFIAGVEEELLPHSRSLSEAEDPEVGLEEERRLFYVGMTRAEDRLTITHAQTRRFFGEDRWTRPSRFLEEIPSELLEGGGSDPGRDEAEVLGAYEQSDSGAALAIGDRVEHAHFGRGVIEGLVGAGVNARAVVNFVHHGPKQLLLQYAKLEKLG